MIDNATANRMRTLADCVSINVGTLELSDSDKAHLLACNNINQAAAELVQYSRKLACAIIECNVESPK